MTSIGPIADLQSRTESMTKMGNFRQF